MYFINTFRTKYVKNIQIIIMINFTWRQGDKFLLPNKMFWINRSSIYTYLVHCASLQQNVLLFNRSNFLKRGVLQVSIELELTFWWFLAHIGTKKASKCWIFQNTSYIYFFSIFLVNVQYMSTIKILLCWLMSSVLACLVNHIM